MVAISPIHSRETVRPLNDRHGEKNDISSKFLYRVDFQLHAQPHIQPHGQPRCLLHPERLQRWLMDLHREDEDVPPPAPRRKRRR